MARIRSIHPGLWTDELFVGLSPFARLMFIGLWNECDDKGIFQWSALKMKMRILPADSVDADELLDEIAASGLVKPYLLKSKKFGAVKNFQKHQRPKKPNDIFPATAEILAFCGFSGEPKVVKALPVGNQFGTSGEKSKQMEDGGWRMEGVSLSNDKPKKTYSKKRATQLPKDFEPKLTPAAEASISGWNSTKFENELDKFKNYSLANGKIYKDWQAAFRTWIGNAITFEQSRGGNHGKQTIDGFSQALR